MEPDTKPLSGVGSHLPRRSPAGPDLETLVAPLGAAGDVDHVAGGIRDVEVEVYVLLPVESGIEFARRVGAQRGVDGVIEEEVRLVSAVAGAGIPGQAVGRRPPDAAHHRHVADNAAELRREPARSDLLEGEAVGIREHLPQGHRIGHVVGDPDRGAVGRPVHDAVLRVQHVGDQQRLAFVEAVDVGAIVGISEIESFRHLLLRIVGVAVELDAVGELVAEVAEKFQVVLDCRVAPDLRRVGHGGVAGRDQSGGVGALNAAVGGIGVAVFQAEVGESARAERQADVGRNGVGIAIARAVGAGVELYAAALSSILEQEIHHAGDGVRAVLSRGAVTQHFHLTECDRGNGRNVRTLGAVRHAGEPGDDRRAVAALAVHQHQSVVVGQIAQAGRPHQRGGVTDGMGGHVEGRDQSAQLIVQRGGSLTGNFL